KSDDNPAARRGQRILAICHAGLIIARMPRRLHVARILPGIVKLDPGQAHHALRVLRLAPGEEIEVFDDAGGVARGVFRRTGEDVDVEVQTIRPPAAAREICLAAATPKGDRADWMIEKLSEIGVARFTPLITARSVVKPGAGKLERWRRMA